MHSAASTLAVQQNLASGFQSGRAGRRWRRYAGHSEGRQRRELLSGVEELYCCYEEPGRKVQRSEVRRKKWAR